MKRISIFSEDKRFFYAKELLSANGYECSIMDRDSLFCADALILPPYRTEKTELINVLSCLKRDATVFTGCSDAVREHFCGRVIDYSDSESFLLKNAYITALCAIRLTFEKRDTLLQGKKALVLGYGRIGKYLSSMLKCLGADVFVYARSGKSREDATLNGMRITELSDTVVLQPYLIYNTVPQIIVGKAITDALNKAPLIMELASAPGGFEDKEAVLMAPGLPGRMMPRSAGEAIFDLVSSTFSGD